MKENVLDVLMYLFENYMDDDVENQPDQDSITEELREAGFPAREIDKALMWLEGLSNLQETDEPQQSIANKSVRIFSEQEKQKFNLECIGFLLFLDNIGAFSRNIREMIIDRAMALETTEIDLEQLKWVMLLVLFNQPGQEAAYTWIEDVIFEEHASNIH